MGKSYSAQRQVITDNYKWPPEEEMLAQLNEVRENTQVLGCSNCFGEPIQPFIDNLDYSNTEYQKSSKYCNNNYINYVRQWSAYWPRGNVRNQDMLESMDPLLMIAIIAKESDFSPTAVSRTGCKGLVQICENINNAPPECKALPSYVKYKNNEITEDELLYDPEFNICYGTYIVSGYIWDMADELKDTNSIYYKTISIPKKENDPEYKTWMSIYLGLTAYNGGPGGAKENVERWLRAREGHGTTADNNCYNSLNSDHFPDFLYYCIGDKSAGSYRRSIINDKENGKYATYVLAIYSALLTNDNCADICGEFLEGFGSFGNAPIQTLPVEPGKNICFLSDFGARREGGKRQHKGVDIHGPEPGTPVLAVADGTITMVDLVDRYSGQSCLEMNSDCKGVAVYMKYTLNNNEYTAMYMHLRPGTVKVSVGQKVKAGEVLAEIGSTGNARGGTPHLHFEIRKDGVPQATVQYLANAYKRC